MDKIGNFNAASAFNTNSNPTRESDIRSSKRRRRGNVPTASATASSSRPAQAPQDFAAQQFVNYAPSGHVLDPVLANLNKEAPAAQAGTRDRQAPREQAQDASQVQEQQDTQQVQNSILQGISGMSGLMLEQLAAGYRTGDTTAMSLALAAAASGEQGVTLTREEAEAAAAAASAAAAAAIAAVSARQNSATGNQGASVVAERHNGPSGLKNGLAGQTVSDEAAAAAEAVASGQISDSQLLQSLPSLAVGNGGSFTADEINVLDRFMSRYQAEHGLDYAALCRRVWANERKKDNFWDAVASALPHRTRASVYKHVRRKYHPYELRGKWSAEDDATLKRMVEMHGAQWKTIGRLIGRMPEDCRDRWRNYVKCGANRGQNKWSVDEENKLIEVVNSIRFGDPSADINWTAVSEKMGGIRSRIQCRYKWKKLNKGLDLAE
ncbi:hypothetical protein V1525DRAFT_368311 [Lipomyces kononenkoae]|uniref:Uncharacterized protein n=1 Tax=Lipomyces kononenkoae TaxID=34357 RepID=A0ACC3TED7_LIPKO